MPSEITRLLKSIEQEHLAARRDLDGQASGHQQQERLQAYMESILASHERLRAFCGPKAMHFVVETLESADLLYDWQCARDRLRARERSRC